MHFAIYALILSVLFAPFPIKGQSVDPANSAALQGMIRDEAGRPTAAAAVELRTKEGMTILTVKTDSQGIYRFSFLAAGVYTLHAEMGGSGGATFGPFSLQGNESKKIDLTLKPQEVSRPKDSSAGTLEFFDKPEFTVTGVTLAASPGGHGSDAARRTRESLTKDVVSLSAELPSDSEVGSSPAATEETLRHTSESEPKNFEAIYGLGKMLVDKGKAQEAVPYLKRADELQPNNFESAWELARAYAHSGQYERARSEIRTLLARQDRSELHHLLGEVEEASGRPLEAVREYQRAEELTPSEPNVFDWGAELLAHRAIEPAIRVFTMGNRKFPRSVRLLAGLGVAWYAKGSYDQAVRRLCEASDLSPDDPEPYVLLGKMQSVESKPPEQLVERLKRFVKFQPENALANYNYALCLWKLRKVPEDGQELSYVESLLEKAVRLDPQLGAGYLQLGILYAERQDFPMAISAYQRSIEVSPELEEAHYRLAHVYQRNGETRKAQKELKLFEQLSKRSAQEAERQRREMLQFVYTLRGRADSSQDP
jgi:tetratricopeptide (TPR) repeat protein